MIDKTVLYVDDSPTMRRIIQNALNRIGITNTVEAENGKDALEKLAGIDPGMIITDWNMPEMNGEEFVRTVRENEQYKKVPILMVTTRGMKDDVMTAIKLGVNGYVVKPFTVDVLKAKISDIIS
ncbi:MAG TPA: two-component system response regulator [Candidatus Marinimicrobia bacterium]|nr:MAG: two-component system response regulator [Candidatus Marinimicrobia bacterium CG1_02_48_14]PIZ63753.1 MAG: two-component system response regulator [Candidatus Marinimicrobia bacterium CG_4_10_14_0_2_um_filter_48_9]PJA54399.1 MAG: two-component system response regulator [Candidatus Marinimicrobia bacterium CG_4_9_14_3_um_filter_48_9]HCW75846.1 two-component system response regulator [Candidatus Neomarinimicrobiota bacterium]